MYICSLKHKNYCQFEKNIWTKLTSLIKLKNIFMRPPPRTHTHIPHPSPPLFRKKNLTVFFWGAIVLSDDDLHLWIKISLMWPFNKTAIKKFIAWIYKFHRRKNIAVLTLRARCRKGRLPKVPCNARDSLVKISHSNVMASK